MLLSAEFKALPGSYTITKSAERQNYSSWEVEKLNMLYQRHLILNLYYGASDLLLKLHLQGLRKWGNSCVASIEPLEVGVNNQRTDFRGI